jgi:hypothetical protein
VSPLRLRTCMTVMALSSRARPARGRPARARATPGTAGWAPVSVRAVGRPTRPSTAAHWCARRRWQVFGLAGPATGRLLAVASQADRAQCLMTAFVPTYRCGAVPDSHRVPCCLHGPGRAAEPAAGTPYVGGARSPSTTCRAGVSCRAVVPGGSQQPGYCSAFAGMLRSGRGKGRGSRWDSGTVAPL